MNHSSIYSVFLVCLCNLNSRFTPLFSNIPLIRVSISGLESKASKEEGKKNKRKNMLQKHCFTEAKQLAKKKKKPRQSEAEEEKSPISSSPRRRPLCQGKGLRRGKGGITTMQGPQVRQGEAHLCQGEGSLP